MALPSAFLRALEDRYTIERQIGQGGMASVYLARDRKHDRQVAIKVLTPSLGSAVGAERFLEEIRVTANLHHPHLLPLFDSGEADHLLYYVMPYVSGESLRARLAREGPLPVAEAVRVAKLLADAVDYAHRNGVVHRDLKPENILLADGQPVIADFGIALAVSQAASATRMTATGFSPGTPQYMSPEQAAGERAVDARTDIYALGAILYEMLAGHPPHVGETARAVLTKVLTERPVNLRAVRDTVPEPIEAAVMRALARLPADRWATAAEFGRALDAAGSVLTPSPSLAEHTRATAGRWPQNWFRVSILVLLAIVIAIVAWQSRDRLGGREAAERTAVPAPRALAVLPFENRSENKEDEYFSDGLTEEVLHQLTQVPGLHVAARTSSFAFKGTQPDLADVASRLKVDAVVSGSVRRAGSLLRVTVQLIDVSAGVPLWSQTYDREAREAFQVQEEIARGIVARLRPALADDTSNDRGTPAETGPSPEAFDLYLKGRYEWNRRTPEGASAAIYLLTKAVEIAPGYARAHAALAEAYAVMGFYDYMPPRVAFAEARAAAQIAAKRDPALAEAPNTLGYVALYHDWDFVSAEREFRRALDLSPRYAVAHQWFANLLTAAGRFPEAAASMRKAAELDPLAPIPHAALGWVQLHARDYRAAEEQLRRTLDTHRDYFLAQLWLAETLALQQRHTDALAEVDRALRVSPANITAQLTRARILALSGRADAAREALAGVQALEANQYVPAYPRALVFVALGERDAAFGLLDRAVIDRAHAIALLRVDPWLDPLRRDPRFDELLQRVSVR